LRDKVQSSSSLPGYGATAHGFTLQLTTEIEQKFEALTLKMIEFTHRQLECRRQALDRLEIKFEIKSLQYSTTNSPLSPEH
jgi:hypothetical protein